MKLMCTFVSDWALTPTIINTKIESIMNATDIQLNEIETRVLKALNAQAEECTGGEFGYLPDVDKMELSKHQFAGYLSQLQQKGVFEYIDIDYSTEYGGQFAIKSEYQHFK